MSGSILIYFWIGMQNINLQNFQELLGFTGIYI